jgi:hypothetical protein
MPLTACGTGSPTNRRDPARQSRRSRDRDGGILLAYFSRAGENYWYGDRRDLKVGNTEVLARMISARLDCDLHRIDAAEPYPDDYDESVERKLRDVRTGL